MTAYSNTRRVINFSSQEPQNHYDLWLKKIGCGDNSRYELQIYDCDRWHTILGGEGSGSSGDYELSVIQSWMENSGANKYVLGHKMGIEGPGSENTNVYLPFKWNSTTNTLSYVDENGNEHEIGGGSSPWQTAGPIKANIKSGQEGFGAIYVRFADTQSGVNSAEYRQLKSSPIEIPIGYYVQIKIEVDDPGLHPLKSYAITGSNTDGKTYPSDSNHQGEYTLDTFKFTTNTTVGIEFYRYIQLFYDSSMMEMTLATSKDTDLQKTVFFSGSETQYKCSYYTKDGYQFNKIELYKGNEQQQIFLYSSYFNFTPNDNYDYKICGYAKAQETPTYSINITRPQGINQDVLKFKIVGNETQYTSLSGIEQGSKFVFVNTMQEQYNCINIKDQNGFSYVCQFGDEYPIMSDLAITYQVKLKKYKITLTKPDDNFEGFDVYVDDQPMAIQYYVDGIAEFYVEYGKKLKIKPNVASGYAPGHFIVNGSIYQPDTYEGYVYSDTIISYTVGQVEQVSLAVKAFKNNQDGGAYLEYAWSDCGISVNGIKIGPTYLGKFDYRTNVNLKCSPNNGFSFVEWVKKVDSDEYLLSTENSVDITLTDPETVVAAHITSIQRQVSIDFVPNGFSWSDSPHDNITGEGLEKLFNIEIDTKGTIKGESTYNTEYDYEMNQTTGRWNAGTSLSSKKYIFSPNQEYQKIGDYSYGITRVDIQYVSKSGRDLPVIAGQTTFDLVENNGVKITCYVTAVGTITGTRTIEFEPTEE